MSDHMENINVSVDAFIAGELARGAVEARLELGAAALVRFLRPGAAASRLRAIAEQQSAGAPSAKVVSISHATAVQAEKQAADDEQDSEEDPTYDFAQAHNPAHASRGAIGSIHH